MSCSLSFHPCGIGLSLVSKGRVPNWNAIVPSSGLSIQLFQSRKYQTPPAITIGTSSEMPPSRIVSRSALRSEEHTSELQSLMRISYAVFCLKKKKTITHKTNFNRHNTTSHTSTTHIHTTVQQH